MLRSGLPEDEDRADERTLAAHDCLGADEVYEMEGVDGPDFAGDLADGRRYRFVDVQSRGELQSYVV